MKIFTHDDQGAPILQGSDYWKSMRAGILTGTHIQDVLPGARGGRLASYGDSLNRIVSEILTGKPARGMRPSLDMQDGVEREPFARMAYEEATGRVVNEVAFVQHAYRRVGVSPDGMIHNERRLCEIKSPQPKTHTSYLKMTQAPSEYVVQIQSQLWITGYEFNDFVSYNPDFPPGLQLHIIEVKRDEEMIAKIQKAVFEFLNEVAVEVGELQAMNAAREAKHLSYEIPLEKTTEHSLQKETENA